MPELKDFFNHYQIMLICLLIFISILIAILPNLSKLISDLKHDQMFSRVTGLLITLLVGFLFAVEGLIVIKFIFILFVVYVINKEAKKLSNFWYAIGESLSNVGINLIASTFFISVFTTTFNDITILVSLFISIGFILIGEIICSKNLLNTSK
jgi:hypothetical protein